MYENIMVEAEIRSELKTGNGYRLKISCLDLGMYIDDFRVVRDDKNSTGWWVQQPSLKVGFRYKKCPEFNKQHFFWKKIESACITKVQEEEAIRNAPATDIDVLLSHEQLDILLNDKPAERKQRYHE